jgi:hypothetical protein
VARWMLGVLPHSRPRPSPAARSRTRRARAGMRWHCLVLRFSSGCCRRSGLSGRYRSRARGRRVATARRPAAAAIGRALLITGGAVTLVLSIGALLLVEFRQLVRVDPGYDSSGLLPRSSRCRTRGICARRTASTKAAGALSGLRRSRPPAWRSHSRWASVDRTPASAFRTSPASRPAPASADLRIVSPSYFRCWARRVRGRLLTEATATDTPRVALVNEAFVRTYLGGPARSAASPASLPWTASRSSAWWATLPSALGGAGS